MSNGWYWRARVYPWYIAIVPYASNGACMLAVWGSYWIVHSTLNCIPFKSHSAFWEESPPTGMSILSCQSAFFSEENGACCGKAGEMRKGEWHQPRAVSPRCPHAVSSLVSQNSMALDQECVWKSWSRLGFRYVNVCLTPMTALGLNEDWALLSYETYRLLIGSWLGSLSP